MYIPTLWNFQNAYLEQYHASEKYTQKLCVLFPDKERWLKVFVKGIPLHVFSFTHNALVHSDFR